ncbi:MAG: glutamine--fructose-6-phosphate transaminase (isomerizing) [Actinomycetota bacterium]
MCGIMGYIGEGDALPVLLDGLRKLEYRGYDSAGVALVSDGGLSLFRKAGPLQALIDSIGRDKPAGSLGIGHTRWATHGAPTDENAHPHWDCTRRVAVVHNGIIENQAALKARLEGAGHAFCSDTDTEVVAHLLESIMEANECDLLAAMFEVVEILDGSFALVCVAADEPGRIVAARRRSPLILGATHDIGLVASDIPALLPFTRTVIPLDDEQIAEVTAGGIRTFDLTGGELEPTPLEVGWDVKAPERGVFDDFMLKEIYEQPAAIEDTLLATTDRRGDVRLDRPLAGLGDTSEVDRIVIVACGTSYHAGLAGRFAIESCAGIPVEVELASEFRYRNPMLGENTLVIGITQSGETADTLAAVDAAHERKAKVLAVTNVLGSSITREADAVLVTRAGPEVGVAATKTFLAQLVAMDLIALHLAKQRGKMGRHRVGEMIHALAELPSQIERILADRAVVHRAAKRYAHKDDFLFMGRGLGHVVALEGALKLKELSYIHAEGYAAGELKHGAIALVESHYPVVSVLTDHDHYDKMLANIQEVRSRGAEVIVVAPEGDDRARSLADTVFWVPETHSLLLPVLLAVPLQLLAYYIAKEKGLSPDKPRNLAKSVTVE